MLSALRPASPQSSTCLSSPCPLLLTPQGAAWFVLTLNIFKAKRIKRRDFSKVRGEGKRTETLSPRHDPGPAVLSQAPLQEPAGYSLRAQDEELGRGGVELWKEREGPHYLSGEAVPGPKSTLSHPSGSPGPTASVPEGTEAELPPPRLAAP